MNTMKKGYYDQSVIGSIDGAIELLCMENGRCTPTDVLRLAGLDESPCMRKIVIERAVSNDYAIKSSGRGYVILDWSE